MSGVSLRVRFTVVTGLTVLAAGAALLAGAYLLADRTMAANPPRVSVYSVEEFGSASTGLPFGPDSTLRLEDGTVLTGQQYKERMSTVQDEIAHAYRQQRTATLDSLIKYGAGALAGVTALAIATTWLLAGWHLRPLHAVTDTARHVAGSPVRLGRRVTTASTAGEVSTLAHAFNAMLERLERAFDAQRRFVANASHELRTPLAIKRSLIDVALDEPDVPTSTASLGHTLLAVNARHERLVDAMLTLAASESDITERASVDLADIAAYVLAEARPQADATGVHVRLDPDPAPVSGEPVLLERMVSNLVSNAIRHNHPGGWLAVTTTVRDGTAVLEVANSGPPVPPAEAEALFEPFRRLETGPQSDAGFGLGLSIVRAIARAHGGEVTLHPSTEGGLAARVTLPATTG